jgi:hypothetical protein
VRTAPPRTRRPSNRPTPRQLEWLRRGLDRPGGSLPIFDHYGQRVSDRTVKSCVDRGWAESRGKALKDWQMCQLTDAGREVLDAD